MLLVLLLQVLASLILCQFVLWAYQKFKLKINIHNLPIIIFSMLMVVCGVYLCFHNPKIYLLIGLSIGALIWGFMAATEDDSKKSIIEKVIASIIGILVWHQIVIFAFFYFYNSDKIKLDE